MKGLLLVLLAIPALAACSSNGDAGGQGRATRSPSAAVRTATTTVVQPSGFTAHHTARFEIALPSGWRELPLTKDQIQAAAREVGGTNPELARLLSGLADNEQYKQLEFYAFDPKSTDRVNVLRAPLTAGATSRQVLDQFQPALPQLFPGAKAKNGKADLEINGLDAAELQYEVALKQPDGSLQTVPGVQFYIINGADLNVVSVIGSPRPSFTGLAERIGNSFKLR